MPGTNLLPESACRTGTTIASPLQLPSVWRDRCLLTKDPKHPLLECSTWLLSQILGSRSASGATGALGMAVNSSDGFVASQLIVYANLSIWRLIVDLGPERYPDCIQPRLVYGFSA